MDNIQGDVVAMLTEAERKGLAEIAADPRVESYALFTRYGEELGGNAAESDLVPVCSNLIDIAASFADHLGEEMQCREMAIEGEERDVTILGLKAMNVVVVREKGARARGRLSHVD
ncbi:MAG: hypothetical protein AAF281_16705 [Pseudomonadota bacterium]